ncbi:FkbM family methyltransferase [Janthinobacterium psychrotolerans]|uniref:FkbM family methyltransferase n=1 Tax=Janthinobacterium psychrotolerans TaxID=1747903 RepID=UPI001C2686AC|nr:FkbM family methyltransferase [Janthinobacterium psychrotolerans]
MDDGASGEQWQGLPVVSITQLPADAMVVNCAMSIAPVEAARKLARQPLRACLSYADLLAERPDLIPLPAFVAEMRADVAARSQRWRQLREQFADNASKLVFDDVLRFRLSAAPEHMASYSVRFADQYFEHFLQLSGEVFVDAGGFDGDTTEIFCDRYPDYQHVFLFEPSAKNMQAAKIRLTQRRDISFVEQGISDQAGTLWFNPDAGSASAVSSAGASSIEVTTLDAALTQPVSFIKMDLEGWEMQALAGAQRHIREDHPKLAISVYHNASDFHRIPDYIATLRQDYDLYLRHYTQGWSETIMFFVPRRTGQPT